MKLKMPSANSWLQDSGYSLQEEIDIYEKQLTELIEDPRWYLDNLEFMREYRVSWKTYRLKSATLRYQDRNARN